MDAVGGAVGRWLQRTHQAHGGGRRQAGGQGTVRPGTVVLDDDFVSTHHARLMPRGSHWIVEDLGSTNGTWIDRERVTAPTVLQPGMPLRIGRTTLEIGHE